MPWTDFSTSVGKISCLGHLPLATLYLHSPVKIHVASYRWARVHRRQGERHIDVCVQETDGKVSLSGQELPSGKTLFWFKIMLRPHQSPSHKWFPGEPGRGRHGLAIQKSGYEPHRTPLRPDRGSYPWHGWPSNYSSTIACGYAAGLGCPEPC